MKNLFSFVITIIFYCIYISYSQEDLPEFLELDLPKAPASPLRSPGELSGGLKALPLYGKTDPSLYYTFSDKEIALVFPSTTVATGPIYAGQPIQIVWKVDTDIVDKHQIIKIEIVTVSSNKVVFLGHANAYRGTYQLPVPKFVKGKFKVLLKNNVDSILDESKPISIISSKADTFDDAEEKLENFNNVVPTTNAIYGPVNSPGETEGLTWLHLQKKANSQKESRGKEYESFLEIPTPITPESQVEAESSIEHQEGSLVEVQSSGNTKSFHLFCIFFGVLLISMFLS